MLMHACMMCFFWPLRWTVEHHSSLGSRWFLYRNARFRSWGMDCGLLLTGFRQNCTCIRGRGASVDPARVITPSTRKASCPPRSEAGGRSSVVGGDDRLDMVARECRTGGRPRGRSNRRLPGDRFDHLSLFVRLGAAVDSEER